MDELVSKLKRICELIVKDPSLMARDGKTFCNFGTNLICSHMGYTGFGDLLANDIYDKAAREWSRTTAQWASEYANSGKLAISAQKGPIHGHVAVLFPGPMQMSPKWKEEVPLIANVGAINGIMGVSAAFRTKPDYFVLKQNEKMLEVPETKKD